MAKLGVCIELLFVELPYAERVRKAKELGFGAYEFWFHNMTFDEKKLTREEKDLDTLADLNSKLGLTITDFVFNHPEGGIVASLIDKRERGKLTEGLVHVISLAKRIGCKQLISASGNRIPDLSRESAADNLIAALWDLAPICEKEGITLTLEPFNTIVDHPDCFLDDPKLCVEVLKAVGSITGFIRENIPLISHFHVAGVPGRHEPDSGELNYPFVIREIDRLGYSGYVGLEYWPTVGHAESLKRTLAYLAG